MTTPMDEVARRDILSRYAQRVREFESMPSGRWALVVPTETDLDGDVELTPLSKRELEVLRLVAEGHTNEEIGQHLFITKQTVISLTKHLLAKLKARSRAHAVARGFRHRLIA